MCNIGLAGCGMTVKMEAGHMGCQNLNGRIWDINTSAGCIIVSKLTVGNCMTKKTESHIIM